MFEPWLYEDICEIAPDPIQQYDQGEVLICACYGRGKTMEDLVLPRLPRADTMQEKVNQLIAASNIYRRTRGKGRGLLRTQPNMAKMNAVHIGGLVVQQNPNTVPNQDGNDTMSTLSQTGSLSSSISSLDNIELSANTRDSDKNGKDMTSSATTVFNSKPWGSWRLEDRVKTGYHVVEDEYSEYKPLQRKPTTLEAFIPQKSPSKKQKKKKKNGRNIDNSSVIGDGLCSEVEKPASSKEFLPSDTSVSESNPPDQYVVTITAGKELLPQADNAISQSSDQEEKQMLTSNCAGSKTWSLHGPHVVQMNNLPLGCDISVLQDIVSSYGMMKNSEVLHLDDSLSIRFQLDSSETCGWVVECLHNTDSMFPNAPDRPLECIHIDQDVDS